MFHDPIPSKPEQLKNLQERFQSLDVFPAEMIEGFAGMEVAVTGEKSDRRKKYEPLDPADAPTQTPDKPNQDCVMADPETGLLGVFDGLGAHKHGDLASSEAATVIPRTFQKSLTWMDQHGLTLEAIRSELQVHLMKRIQRRPDNLPLPQAAVDAEVAHMNTLLNKMEDIDPAILKKSLALLKALESAHKKLLDNNDDRATTACVGFVHTSPDARRFAVVANIGDSGACIRRANGDVEVITESDSLLGSLLSMEEDENEHRDLIQQLIEIRDDPGSNLSLPHWGKTTRSYKKILSIMTGQLGASPTPCPPSLRIHELFPGDELIFCTDGVIDKFQKHDYTPETRAEPFDLQGLAEALTVDDPTLIKRSNALRNFTASLNTRFKGSDDIALVIARILEQK